MTNGLMDGQNDYRRGRHVVSGMHVHLVFVTKYRRGVFNDETLTRCEEIMRKVCEDFEACSSRQRSRNAANGLRSRSAVLIPSVFRASCPAGS